MADLVYFLTTLLLFDIPLLYYYINLKSSIIFCIFSGDIHLSLAIYLSVPIFSFSFVNISELLCGKFLETFVILSKTLLPIKSPVASTAFRIALFEAVVSTSVVYFLPSSRSFWLYLLLKYSLRFYL